MTTAARPPESPEAIPADGTGAEPAGSAPGRGLGRARDVVITVLGVLGILTLVWLAASWAFSLSIIVFVTGSMSPTMPTGAAAIVQTVAATDLAVGDVVTVLKAKTGTPVTHRIVEIAEVPGRADARELTLQGDANSFADSETHVVEEAPRVLVAAPVIGWAIIGAKTPMIMVTLAVVIAAAIAWALWPSRSARRSTGQDPPLS